MERSEAEQITRCTTCYTESGHRAAGTWQQAYKAPKATLLNWHNGLAHLSHTRIRKFHTAEPIRNKRFKYGHGVCNMLTKQGYKASIQATYAVRHQTV